MKTVLSIAASLVSATSFASISNDEGLSHDLLIRAWGDPGFYKELITNPVQALNLDPANYQDVIIHVDVDTDLVRHFILPTKLLQKNWTLDNSDELADFRKINVDNKNYEALPLNLQMRIQSDDILRKRLLSKPNQTLSKLGYTFPYKVKILENSENERHIIIPKIPFDLQQLKEIEKTALMGISSTKCCATGTCACQACHIVSPKQNDTEKWPPLEQREPSFKSRSFIPKAPGNKAIEELKKGERDDQS